MSAPPPLPPAYGSPPNPYEVAVERGAPPPAAAPADQNEDRDPEAEALVREFEAYDFGNDADFRKGLPAILKQAKGKSADIDAIIGRAQWFYFNQRKGVSVPFEVYRRFRKGELESRPMGTSKKHGSLMSGGAGAGGAQGAAQSSASGAAPSVSAAGSIGAAAGGGAVPKPAHGEGISVLSAEDDAAQTRAAVVVESSGVVPRSAPGNDMPFDQVVRLIQEGRANEVPRKDIPEGLNDEPASKSTMAPRRKPWETDAADPSSAQAQQQGGQQDAPAQ